MVNKQTRFLLLKNLFKLCISFIIFLTSLFSLNSCSWKKDNLSSKIVLKAENNEMTAEEFAKILAEKISVFDALSAKDLIQINRIKSDIERDFVIKAIIENYAKNENLFLEKNEVELEINKIRSSFPNDLSFRQELSKQGLSFDKWQQKMSYNSLEKKVFKNITKGLPDPTIEAINQYYESNKFKYNHKEKILLRQIVIDTEATADKIQEALKNNKKFEDLATDFSIAPESKKQGLIGWVEKGMLEVFDKAFSVPLHKPSATFASPYGFHIFRVENKLPAGIQKLSEVKESIVLILRGQREQALYMDWLNREIKKIHIYKDHRIIQAMSVETRGK